VSLVKSVFGGKDGREKVVQGATDCCVFEGRGRRGIGEEALPHNTITKQVDCQLVDCSESCRISSEYSPPIIFSILYSFIARA